MSADPVDDQIDAACVDLRDVLDDVADIVGAPIQEGNHGPAVERLLDGWRATVRAGRVYPACPHVRPGPQIVAGLLHRPGPVRCWPCAAVAARVDGLARPDECDACGRYASRFAEVLVAVGPIALSANLCRRCFPPSSLN